MSKPSAAANNETRLRAGTAPPPPVNAVPQRRATDPPPVSNRPPPPPVNAVPQLQRDSKPPQLQPRPPASVVSKPPAVVQQTPSRPPTAQSQAPSVLPSHPTIRTPAHAPEPQAAPKPLPAQPPQPKPQPQPPVQAAPQPQTKPQPVPPQPKVQPQPPVVNTQPKAPVNPKQQQIAQEDMAVRNRVNSPQFQNVNLRGSEGLRSSPSLRRENILVRSSDTFVADARNHPHAQFAQIVETYASRHKKPALHSLKVTKIPFIEQAELRIKSYSSSSILETPISAGADIYTAVAYGLYGDASLGAHVRNTMIDTLRELANWLESSQRSDIAKVVAGMTLEDLQILFKYLVPEDNNMPDTHDDDGAAGGIDDGGQGSSANDKGKNVTTEQGMVVDKKKKKRKNQLSKDTARDQKYARALRGLSNDISHFDDAHGNYIHPLTIIAIASALYSRSILLFSVRAGNQVKLHSVLPPRPGTQLPIYLAVDEKDTSMIFMLVPQVELHSFHENQLFFERHVMETLALVPAYNEGEEEIMRTYLSFKKECREELQLIFFVDGVLKNGADINHNTLQALLNHMDFVKMGISAPVARFGKDDLAALVADVRTLEDKKNATAEYVAIDRSTDAPSHIAVRVWVKKNNSGKKQSQLKFFEYLSKRSVQPRYLLFVDSDTRFENPAVSALKDALDLANTGKPIPEIGGVTGEIIVENLSAGYYILGATQYFEYKMSHHLGKRAESSFNRVSCLAGAFSMFECRALMDPRVIADFAQDTKENSLWHYNKKNLGEDRYLTAQLLEAGYGTSFEPKALSSTVAPDTLRGFIAQRRRWDNSTLVNQIDLIFASKKSVFSLWGGRYTLPWVWNFIDFIFTLFMPGNMILLLCSIVNSIMLFTIMVSVTAITRLIASLAVSIPLGRYRRMLGTVGMFDALFSVMIVILFKIMLDYDATRPTYEVFYDKSAVIYAALGRAFVVTAWYLGMRRGGWIAYAIGIGATVLEGVLILSLNIFDAYGVVLGVFGVAFLLIEGFLVWKTTSPRSANKLDDTVGLCCYLSFIFNIVLLGAATVMCYISVSDLKAAREVAGETSIPSTLIMLPIAVVCGIWMWALHFPKMRSWLLIMNAIVCNVLYLIGIVVTARVLGVGSMNSFTTGYYPYVAVLSCIFQLLVSSSSVRWAFRLKNERRKYKLDLKKGASVNPTTGSMWHLNESLA